MATIYVPNVYERYGRDERPFDLFSRLLKDRIIFLGTPINDDLANIIVAQLLFLQMEDPKKDIHVYINSPGGSVTAGLAIYDTLQYVKPDIITYCIGQAGSMAAVLLASGAKGKRYSLPHSRIMLHQPWGGVHGQATDISIQANEILRLKERLNQILAKHTGQDLARIEEDTDREFFMGPEEAREYGLVDLVVESRSEVKAPDEDKAKAKAKG